MKLKIDKKYLKIGLTAFFVIIASVVFLLCLLKLDVVWGTLVTISDIFAPIMWGIIIAYLLNPICNLVEKFAYNKLFTKAKTEHKRKKGARIVATIVSVLFLLAILSLVILLIVPQIGESLTTIGKNFKNYYDGFLKWIDTLQFEDENLMLYLEEGVKSIFNSISEWFNTSFFSSATEIITTLGGGVIGAFLFITDFLIGIIVSVYILLSKDKFIAQGKKIMFALFKISTCNALLKKLRYTHNVFSRFISGKILDSAIIGVLCFICMTIFNFPYPLLISVIIGITNVIPFFGPIIGAVPGALLILLVDPMQLIYFLIFVLALQQFDGNILGPRILGEVVGIHSFWVLFSLLIGGGLFGLAGMILSVPLFAVIYTGISAYINKKLKKKNLSTVTDNYLTIVELEEVEPLIEKTEQE